MSISMSGAYITTPDTTSDIYPDRLIRPLPKRTLRSRLSSEAADSINYPPNLPTSSLPAFTQYGDVAEIGNDAKVHVQQQDELYEHTHDHLHGRGSECCHHEEEEDGFESIDEYGSLLLRRSSGHPGIPRNSQALRYSCKNTAADGYDAFENTNNKKKRKIPTSGNPGLHHVNLSADLASLKLSGSASAVVADDSAGVRQYYGSGSAAIPVGSGLSGAGRGRYGRDAVRRNPTRNPLGVSVNGSNAWMAGRTNRDHSSLRTNDSKDHTKPADQGIISAAIANATALLRKPLQKGQENASLLDQPQKPSPTNSQFTFTCESDAAKGMTFPEQSLYSAGYTQRANNLPTTNPPASHKLSNHATQTSPNNASLPTAQPQPALTPNNGQQTDVQGKKPRRSRSELYARAERARRRRQEANNRIHPPGPEDLWICEFCEYEDIFGMPPLALIRQYEAKDRKEQKRLREKRRLLEKAKMKGRKGKKPSKSSGKNATHATHSSAQQQPYDDPLAEQDYEGQGEGYFDDGYEDDPMPMPAPPRSSVKHPSLPTDHLGGATSDGRVAAAG